MLAYQAAVMAQAAAIEAGTEPPKLSMDAGTHSNFANVCQGHLKTLGIERTAQRGPTLREYMDGVSVSPIKPSGVSP